MGDLPELTPALRERYGRQLRVGRLGEEGQRRLLGARVAVVGCGALGASLSDLVARAGVGYVRLIDRDIVELSNLHRQRLYDAADAAEARPKAVVAAERLGRVVDATLEPRVVDVTARTVRGLVSGVDLVLDGTDNFETRFLLDEACREAGVPWVHAAVVGTSGQVMAILPEGPCYTCFQRDAPPPGSYETCDTAGVLGPAVDLVAATAALEGMKVLLGRSDECARGLIVLDAWQSRVVPLTVKRRPDCPVCAGEFRWLRDDAPREAARLCGRDSVQLPARGPCDLAAIAGRLEALGTVRLADGVLRFVAPECELLVFDDGRAIVRGVDSVERARSLFARYVG